MHSNRSIICTTSMFSREMTECIIFNKEFCFEHSGIKHSSLGTWVTRRTLDGRRTGTAFSHVLWETKNNTLHSWESIIEEPEGDPPSNQRSTNQPLSFFSWVSSAAVLSALKKIRALLREKYSSSNSYQEKMQDVIFLNCLKLGVIHFELWKILILSISSHSFTPTMHFDFKCGFLMTCR